MYIQVSEITDQVPDSDTNTDSSDSTDNDTDTQAAKPLVFKVFAADDTEHVIYAPSANLAWCDMLARYRGRVHTRMF